jgi:pimeloyl-ACP methyl ester carboxylesterase
MPEPQPASVAEMAIGPDLPTLKIGDGPRILVYLPGLSPQPGLPTGGERRMASSGWEPLLDRYSVYRVGRRVRPVGTTFAEMADDVATAIEALAHGAPVDLMGASTGGVVAIHVAATRPDLVRRLTLVISGPRLGGDGRAKALQTATDIRARRWRRAFATIFAIGGASRLSRLGYGALGWLLGPRLVGIPHDPTLILAELEAWAREDADPLIERIRCPTLVIGTERDPLFTPASTTAFAARLSEGTVTIVPRLAHSFPADALDVHVSPFLG